MGEFLRLLLDFAAHLSPVRIVYSWQRACYFVAGRLVGVVGPGLKVVVPYLCDVRPVSVVPAVYGTPLQTVTLRDGRTLAFSASVTVQVTDPAAAYTTLDHYEETVVEIAAGVLSDGLANADSDRFDPAPERRGLLLIELRDEVNAAIRHHGLSVSAVRLNNFVLGVPTVRVLADRATLGAG